MASSGKKKTTMAKLARENRLRERRQNKQARKDARMLEPSDPDAFAPNSLEEDERLGLVRYTPPEELTTEPPSRH